MTRQRWVLVALGSALLALAALVFFYAQRVLEDVHALEANMAALNVALQEPLPRNATNISERVRRVGAQLQAVDRKASDLEADLGPLLGWLPYLERVPRLGGDLAVAPQLLAFIHRSAELGRHLEKIALALLDPLESSVPSTSSRLARATLALQAQQAEVGAALEALDTFSQERQRIRATNLSPRVTRALELIDANLPQLRDALETALLLPDLLGAHGQRRYLLVFQNSDEIRATGGFISSVGVVTLARGELTDLTFADSAAVDDLTKPHLAPPIPLTRYMGAGAWIFRDTNWSPDFPTAARAMQTSFEVDRGLATDGVLALDETAVGRLLDALGGIELPDYQVQVNSENLLSLIKQYYGQPVGVPEGAEKLAWYAHRKDFMADLLRTFIKRAQAEPLDPNIWTQTLAASARARHLQIYLTPPQSQALLRRYQLDGAIVSTPGEYLQWVDSNVGFNKVDPRIARRLVARFTLKPGERTRATVTMTYTNTNPLTGGECVQVNHYESDYVKMQTACYWDYARLYVTRGSEFIAAIGEHPPEAQPPEGEGQATGFGAFLVVPTGATQSVTFEFWGKRLEGRTFELLVQKQAGLLSLPAVIEIDFPKDWRISQVSPMATDSVPGRMVLDLTLTGDQTFRVVFAGEGKSDTP